MRYLYGNSAPSPLQSNFLAYLRDVMEFCVHVLLAQERITELRHELRTCEEYSAAERQRIEGLQLLIIEAANAANTDGAESMSRRAANMVKAVSAKAIESILAELDAKLAATRADLAAKERNERDRCLESFGQWVALHQPHDGTWRLAARFAESGRYEGEISGVAPYGIAWKYAIELDSTHPMFHGSKVGDLVHQIELAIPETTGGWLKKETKLRPQRIDDYSIDLFEHGGGESRFALRATPRGPIGLDVVIRDDAVVVVLAGAKEATEVDVNEDNRQRFLTLRDRALDAMTTDAKARRRVMEATLDRAPLCDGEDLSAVANCLIAAAAPLVMQIRKHSLAPDELVIRRLLSNDQRVETFVSTASLLEKVGRLPRHLRPLFAPLGLQWQRAQTPVPVPVSEPDEPVLEATAGDRVSAAGAMASLPSVIVDPEASAPGEAPADSVEAALRNAQPETHETFAIDARTKEALAATVKRIVAFARQGQTSDAYEAYAALFEDEDFAKQRPQDQRQVLKLMLKATTDSPPIEPMKHAYRSALARLRALAAETNDPTDRQLYTACEELLAGGKPAGKWA